MFCVICLYYRIKLISHRHITRVFMPDKLQVVGYDLKPTHGYAKRILFTLKKNTINKKANPKVRFFNAFLKKPSLHILAHGRACAYQVTVAVYVVDTVHTWPELMAW